MRPIRFGIEQVGEQFVVVCVEGAVSYGDGRIASGPGSRADAEEALKEFRAQVAAGIEPSGYFGGSVKMDDGTPLDEALARLTKLATARAMGLIGIKGSQSDKRLRPWMVEGIRIYGEADPKDKPAAIVRAIRDFWNAKPEAERIKAKVPKDDRAIRNFVIGLRQGRRRVVVPRGATTQPKHS